MSNSNTAARRNPLGKPSNKSEQGPESKLKLKVYGTLGAILSAAVITWVDDIGRIVTDVISKLGSRPEICVPWIDRCAKNAIPIKTDRLIPGLAAVCRESVLAGTTVYVLDPEGRDGFPVKVLLHTFCTRSELDNESIHLHPDDMRRIFPDIILNKIRRVSIHILRESTTDLNS